MKGEAIHFVMDHFLLLFTVTVLLVLVLWKFNKYFTLDDSDEEQSKEVLSNKDRGWKYIGRMDITSSNISSIFVLLVVVIVYFIS
jgi:hypothetical protein